MARNKLAQLRRTAAVLKKHLISSFEKSEQLRQRLNGTGAISLSDSLEVDTRLEEQDARFAKYEKAQQDVECHNDESDTEDDDFEVQAQRHETVKNQLKLLVANQATQQPQAQNPPGASHHSQSLPKFAPKKPPVINQDIDLKNFTEWILKWNIYASLMEMEQRPREKQVQAFWDCLSGGFLTIVRRSIGIESDTTLEVSQIISSITTYLRSIRNRNLDWRNLLSLRQKDSQGYDSLCNELLELADFADTANVTTDRLHTALLMIAMTNESDRQKLMAHDPPLSFVDARKFILTLETTRKDAKALGQSPTIDDTQVDGAKATKYKKNKWGGKDGFYQKGDKGDKKWQKDSGSKGKDSKKDPPKQSKSDQKLDEECTKCGRKFHRNGSCPAKGKNCGYCGKPGHLSDACRDKRGDPKASKGDAVSAEINNVQSDSATRFLNVNVRPKGVPSVGFIANCDTGSDVTLIDEKQFNDVFGRSVSLTQTSGITLRSINRGVLKQIGSFEANISHESGKTTDTTVFVCEGVAGLYLSLNVCKALDIVHENFPHPMEKIAAQIDIEPDKVLGRSPKDDTASQSSGDVAQPDLASEVWPDREKWIQTLSDSGPGLPETFALIDKKLRQVYTSVFDDSTSTVLKTMKGGTVGEPMHIHLKDDAKPFAIHVARQIPLHLQDKTKQLLDYMVKTGVITEVGDIPTDWCHPIVCVPKPHGDVRMCIDLTRLNSQVRRTTYHTMTPAEAISGFTSKQKFFAKLDLVKGYWQMPLDEQSSWLTVFITPFGKYRYLRSPMGFISTGDSFSYRGDVAFSGLKIRKVVDDCGLGASTLQDLVRLVCDVLERCHKHQITINPKKSTLCAQKIDFVGYNISEGTIKPDSKKLDALRSFPSPGSRTDLRSFVGLAQQLGSFSPRLAEALQPLRELLKTRTVFAWTTVHENAFKEAKEILTSPPVLGMFIKNAETVLQTDASRKNGLGFALLQKQDGEWRLIQCGSRFLQDGEPRYAMVELESLAIEWAIKKCKHFLAGIEHFTVITDHRPLQTIYNNYGLVDIENPRVLNHRSKLTDYSFTVQWKKGREHCIPDALSRAPVDKPEPDDSTDRTDQTCQVNAAIAEAVQAVPDLQIEELRKVAKDDQKYQNLKTAILADLVGSATDPYVLQFKKMADELAVEDELVIRGNKLVVPPSATKSVVDKLHASHAGVERTKRRARQSLFWPGMASDIWNTIQSCWECQKFRPSARKEPMLNSITGTRPFEVVSTDLFQYGTKHYLVYVDTFSNYPLVTEFRRAPSASDTIATFRRHFSKTGVPNILRSDNGPQFSAEISQKFLRRWGVKWQPSSPYYPQGNGHAEVTVKKIKHLLAKCDGVMDADKFHEGILEMRNTPMSDGLSPAQRLFGRPLRSLIPAHYSQFAPIWQDDMDAADRRRLSNQQKAKSYYDASSTVRRALKKGDFVLVQNEKSKRWDTFAIVVESGANRSYRLRFPSGKIVWRNSRFLRKIKPDSMPEGERKELLDDFASGADEQSSEKNEADEEE